MFPKGDRLTVGVIQRKGEGAATRAYLARLLDGLGLTDRERLHDSGHLTRWREPGSPVRRGRVLVAGDAAGLLEPWTREGIADALRSGIAAGEAAATGNEAALAGYEAYVATDLEPEQRAGARLLRLFERAPALVHLLMTRTGVSTAGSCASAAARSACGSCTADGRGAVFTAPGRLHPPWRVQVSVRRAHPESGRSVRDVRDGRVERRQQCLGVDEGAAAVRAGAHGDAADDPLVREDRPRRGAAERRDRAALVPGRPSASSALGSCSLFTPTAARSFGQAICRSPGISANRNVPSLRATTSDFTMLDGSSPSSAAALSRESAAGRSTSSTSSPSRSTASVTRSQPTLPR